MASGDGVKQEIYFPGTGMNKDDDWRDLRNGDSPHRLNLVCDIAEEGGLENGLGVIGNTLCPYTQPAGVNVEVGWCPDFRENGIIYAVYNSNGDHQIRRWLANSNTIELLLEDSKLNFKLTSKITNMNVLDGILYWTDGYFGSFLYDGNNILDFNPPRKANIEKMLAYTNGDPGGYNSIEYETISRLKYRPAFPPLAQYAQDLSLPYNNLYGKLYQFCYRWIHDDNEKSVWSELSKLAYPLKTWRNIGNDSLDENILNVYFLSGGNTVKKIEVGIKINGVFHSVRVIDKYDDTGTQVISDNVAHAITYTGIEREGNIPIDEYLIQQSYVPRISRCQEIANRRIFDADIDEDYDRPTIDVEASFEIYPRTDYVNDTVIDPATGIPNIVPFSNTPTSDYHTPIPTFKGGGEYQLAMVYRGDGGHATDAITDESLRLRAPHVFENATLPTNIFDPIKLNWAINHQPPDFATHYQLCITFDLRYFKKTQFLVYDNHVDVAKKRIKLPPYINYSFERGDRIRLLWKHAPSDFSSNSNVPFFLPTFPPAIAAADIDGIETLPRTVGTPTYEIVDPGYGTPNQDYDWVIEDFDTSTWELTLAKKTGADWVDLIDIHPGANYDPGNVFNYSTQSFLLEIYNPNKQDLANKQYFSIGEEYEIGDAHLPTRYHKGDTADQNPGVTPATGEIFGFDAYLRKNIFKTDGTYIWVEIPNTTESGVNPYGWNAGQTRFSLPIQAAAYFENIDTADITVRTTSGPAFSLVAVTSVGRSEHAATNTPVFKFELAAAVAGTYAGAVTYVRVLVTKSTDVWSEHDSFSDKFPSAIYNDSKVTGVVENFKARRNRTKIRWSEKYFENTFINGMSDVKFDAYKNLEEDFNEITMIRKVGYMLKAHQRNKISSILIDRSEFEDSVGNINVIKSSEVLGSATPSKEIYGSISPKSDIASKKNSYWVDLLSGDVVRDDYNGVGSISGDTNNPKDIYKMSRHFRELCKEILEAGEENFDIVGIWCDRTKSYIISFQDKRELWGGGDIVRNGDFSSGIGWATDPTANIAGGKGVFNNANGDSLSNNMLFSCIEGQTYVLTFIVSENAGNMEGSFNVVLGGEILESYNAEDYNPGDTITLEFVAPITSNFLAFVSTKDLYLSIDDVSILVDATTDLSQTVMFHEPTNRWKTFLSHVPEGYGAIGKHLVSFKDGELWVHYTNPLYNNFYGVQYQSEIDLVINQYKDVIKVFDTITMFTTELWEVSEMEILPHLTCPGGMMSRLPKGRFTKKEGKAHASILRDMTTPGHPHQRIALQNGRRMRGDAMRIRFVNDETFLVPLKSVVVEFTQSKL